MTQNKLNEYREDNTREIEMPDGSARTVRMTPLLWDNMQFLQSLEGITPTEVASYALEEMELQKISFDNAFRAVVTHFANRWT